ncbi:MAG: flippase-like domain-containing protein [Synechococcaceae cyanobacterium RL_1_2]|nr:flippase-like domain-containing protein [Synechococcaceae cyanobacterium RL_1_2]
MKKIISIVVSVLILVLIYWKLDFEALIKIFYQCDLKWLIISTAMVIPLNIFTAWRLQHLMPTDSTLGFWEANKLTIVANVLNMVLPSKMGEVVKAYFMKDRGHLSGNLALSLVIFEKCCDFLALLGWCVFGLGFYPQVDKPWWLGLVTLVIAASIGLFTLTLCSTGFANFFFNRIIQFSPAKIAEKITTLKESWQLMHQYFWQDGKKLFLVASNSIFLWFLHLLQIWLYILTLKTSIPFLANLALSPLAILAGLMPLTFGGVGTRDAAIIVLYQPYLPQVTAVALGLLCTTRYLVPAILGLPFLNEYMNPKYRRSTTKG